MTVTRTFDWNNYVTLAKTLADSDDEAALRTAISRAYFGALHIAEEACISGHVLIPLEVVRGTRIDRSHHARVITALTRHDDEHLRKAGEFLHKMRGWRNGADYESVFWGDVSTVARDVLNKAERVKAELDAFIRDQGPSETTETESR
jgi:hypothetical protein